MSSLENVTELSCEYVVNPLGVDATRPRFSWVTKSSRRGASQTAYEIIVSDTIEELKCNIGNIWESGRENSSTSFCIEYGGSELQSGKRYFWKVRAWDEKGSPTDFSEPSWWEMGLLDQEDWIAKWIEGGKIFRKEFEVDKNISRARAYISSLGYYELRINGQKVGDRVLDPAPSDWNKRVYYATYDVTALLRKGKNAAGLMLGNGKCGSRKVILQISIDSPDGMTDLVGTDETWLTSDESPIISDDIYDGETYDAGLEKDGWDSPGFVEKWNNCTLAEPPAGKLVSSTFFPPIKVVQNLRPVSILEPQPSVYVVDFGQNFSGWMKVKVQGFHGSEIKMRFAELLYPNGMVNQGTNRAARNTDTFILKGGSAIEEFEPRFTYHGFRYVEVTGFPGAPSTDNFEGRVIHSAVEDSGSFLCSNHLINRIHSAFQWSQRGNLMGIPTDSPQRNERLGWLQDAMLASEAATMNFWMVGFFEKLLNDIADSQLADGAIADVVPSFGERYPADSSCGSAYASIALHLYVFYGDKRALEYHYERIKKWVEYEISKSVDYTLDLSKYGDWCAPGHVRPEETPAALISTFWHYKNCKVLAEISFILGRLDEVRLYSARCNKIAESFNKKFLSERKDRNYAHTEKEHCLSMYGPTQTCNLLPLHLGIVPDEKLDQILEGLSDDIGITKDGHIGTGIIGTAFFFDTLTEFGLSELAYKVAAQSTYPSFGYMIKEGATTLWERWEYLTGNGMNSHNHVMFGSIDGWFYKSLAGIRPDRESAGFKHFFIVPEVVGDLKSVSSSIGTISGQIQSEWCRFPDSLEIRVVVPPGTTASVLIPTMGWRELILKESGETIFDQGASGKLSEGITGVKEMKGRIVCELVSGNYTFQLSGST